MNRGIKLWSVAGAVALAFSCSEPPWDSPARLKPGGTTNKLVVVSTGNPQTLYRNERGELDGLGYAALSLLARELGLETEFRLVESEREVWRQIRENRAHISLSSGAALPEASQAVSLGRRGRFSVVCAGAKSAADLENLTVMVAHSSLEKEVLGTFLEQHPARSFKVQAVNKSASEVLMDVARKADVCTVAERDMLAVHQSFLPELRSVLHFKQSVQLAWPVAPGFAELATRLQEAYQKAQKRGDLAKLERHHRESLKKFNIFEARVFVERMHSRLPEYEELFKKASEASGFPWQLLAALSYQESHWDREARSYTGVEGLMMLTLATAREMGVKDRKNPKEAIPAGALYLKKIYKRLPSHLEGADRLAMALASYNVGYGHLQDARMLAVMRDRNPNRWLDLKEVLPLLSHPAHSRKLRYGRARGHEPVQFVERIHFYWSLLESRRPPENPTPLMEPLYTSAHFSFSSF